MIRKILSLFVLTLLYSFPAAAQWSAGLSGGASLFHLNWKIKSLNTDIDYKPSLGWQAGGQIEYAFSTIFSLRAALAYQQLRSHLSDLTNVEGAPTSGCLAYTFNALNGGLLVKVSPFKKANRLYFFAGPSVTQLMNGYQEFKGDLDPGFENTSKRQLNFSNAGMGRTHWLADVGIGYGFACGAHGSIAAECRYQYGLFDFSTSKNVDARVQNTLITAGYFHHF